jgi:16S rRNA (cytosine967-C5)-methyltransferase
LTNPAPSSKPSTTSISPARAAAFEILERVALTDAHSDDLLHSSRLTDLSQLDRNLATTLVLGVLRWQIALDALIQPLLSRPDIELASPVATAIRLGAFQLRYLDRIPAHAALSESVELVRSAGHGHASGMVNAILRKLTRTPPPRVPLVETTVALAQRLSHPHWLVTRWQKNYGRAATIAICDYDQTPPEQGTLFAANDDATATVPGMDDGSRLVAELAAAAHPAPQRIWDCCAAPGGKTLILAARHPKADILATDLSPRRLRSLADRLKPLAPNVRTEVADAAHVPADKAAFDLILCDVPCSGTGTLGRNPELKLRLQPADLSRQAVRQREILLSALSCLAPGGRLLYSTCSLEPEENEQVITTVLAKAPAGIRAVALDETLASLNLPAGNLLREGNLRTLPGASFQGDGFFAALFSKEPTATAFAN